MRMAARDKSAEEERRVERRAWEVLLPSILDVDMEAVAALVCYQVFPPIKHYAATLERPAGVPTLLWSRSWPCTAKHAVSAPASLADMIDARTHRWNDPWLFTHC